MIPTSPKIWIALVSILFWECHFNDPSNSQPPMDDENIVFIGTYTRNEGHVNGQAEGIYSCRMDTQGNLEILNVFKEIINPTYLAIHPDGRLLYAVSETVNDQRNVNPEVVAFKINEDYSLTEINRVSAMGGAPCHISINIDHQAVLIANYVGGNFVSYSFEETGQLTEPMHIFQATGSGPHLNQNSAHGHYVNTHPNGFLYTTDLGNDRVYVMDLKDSLSVVHEFPLAPGSGPRHLAFHPNQQFNYILNELSGSIQATRILSDGSLQPIQLISAVDTTKGETASSADIKVTPNGQYLYASSRGDHNSVAAYNINAQTGELKLIGHYPSGGKTPRAMALAPNAELLLVANQDTDNIYVYQINSDGHLDHQEVNNQIPTPVCIQFLPR